MSNFLGLDTSSRYLTVIARRGERVAVRHIEDCAMRHSVVLMGEIKKALEEVDLKPEECDFFAAVTGPGSFTGIRIGIATAKGFATAVDKPLLSITSFELLAYNVADDNFYTVIDAAHSHYYVCGFGKGKAVTLNPCYLSQEEVEKLEFPLYGFEDLPLKNYTRLEVKNCLYPAICGSNARLSRKMQALYVRKSQAEEARAAINGGDDK